MMKNLFLIVLLIVNSLSFGQTQKITKLLNMQLQREFSKFYDNQEKANFSVKEPFRIDENNVLHLSITLEKNEDGQKVNVSRQVPLDKIVAFDKDIYVYFHTLGPDVTETQTNYDQDGNIVQIKTEQLQLFFTEIYKENHPNKFMHKVIKAFKKAGYDIENGY